MTLSTQADRRYVPAIGARVKLREWSDYSKLNVHVWSWFTVRCNHEHDGMGNIHCRIEHYNTGNTGEYFTVPASRIDPPIGWKPRYTIHCKPEETAKVLSWFDRGIVVRANHDLGSSMGSAFQPMDNSNTPPHWRYPELTDAIPAKDCARLFRVVSVYTEEISLGHDPNCSRCHVTVRDTIARLASARSQTVEETLADIASGTIHFTEYHAYDEANGTYACHCNVTLHDIGRSKRAKTIKQMKADGWEVQYIPFAGGFWERTKETVVQDWK